METEYIMKKTTFIGLLLMFVLVAVGCAPSNSNSKTQSGKLKISTTFFPIYDITRKYCRDEGDVSLVIGAGTEPHDYEPSAKEIAKMSEADALVYDSEYMETWIPAVLKTIESDSKVKAISATKDMVLLPGGEEEEEEHDHAGEGHSHEYDPHVWLSPERAIQMVQKHYEAASGSFP